MSFLIEPLRRSHDRKSFACLDEIVDTFLGQRAMRDQELELSRTRVLIEKNDPAKIIGFHTLLFTQIPQYQIPNDRPNIKRPIPVVLLGQIGIDRNFQGKGLGDWLLTDAQWKVLEIAQHVGVRALILDARDESLATWYRARDFTGPSGSLRMAKHIDDIRHMFL